MLYHRNKAKQLDPALFRKPTSEYRGTPFWAWNTRLDPQMLLEQIDIFKKMGFGGFHIHARTGLETAISVMSSCTASSSAAKKRFRKRCCAGSYDEDRYPSGAAGA